MNASSEEIATFPLGAIEHADEHRGAAVGKQTLRVLHIINGEHYAGAERVQDLLAARLPDFGVDVEFAVLKPGEFARRRACARATVHDFPMHGKFDLSPSRRIADLAQSGGYDLLHTHTTRGVLIGRKASIRTGLPLVHHVHSPATRDSARWWSDHCNGLVERICVRHAAAVATVSRSMAEYTHARGVPIERVFVIPNGVPTPEPLPVRAAPTDSWRLGMVALFRPRKGIEVLLQAMARLRETGRNVRLSAVGAFEDEGYRQEVLRLVAKLNLEDAIDWLGFQKDVHSLLAQLDVLVVPSLFGEGLPMVVLEAMATGVPVVASDVEGICEAIRHEQDGLIAPPGDAEQLAHQLQRLVSHEVDWQALRQTAYERQQACFSDRHMAKSVAELYRYVLAQSRPAAVV